MCGIFGIVSSISTIDLKFEKYFALGKNRGPNSSTLIKNDHHWIGFHRLNVINDENTSNQPFYHKEGSIEYILLCNGEIFNYKVLMNDEFIKDTNYQFISNSDCEVILPLYLKYKDNLLYLNNVINGEYAFCIIEHNIVSKTYKITLANDHCGIRPLFYTFENNQFLFSSTLNSLIINNSNKVYRLKQGHYLSLEIQVGSPFDISHCIEQMYYNVMDIKSGPHLKVEEYAKIVYNSLYKSTKERLLHSNINECCILLSGGLDSSIIVGIFHQILKELQLNDHNHFKIKTFSIGSPSSPDLKYARIVANYFGTEHHEYNLNNEEIVEFIPTLIETIGTLDITTIRASLPHYKLISNIAKDFPEIKVIFGGEGSDELFGGYLYFHNAPTNEEFDNECKRLISNISNYDVLRCDRSTACNGKEARVPFLSKEFIETVFKIPVEYRVPLPYTYNNKTMVYEKFILRKAFESILPKEIAWRRKEAFSDGITSSDKSLFQIINESIHEDFTSDVSVLIPKNSNRSKEACFYCKIYNSVFGPQNHLLDEYWMPNWSTTGDPSARTLVEYKRLE